MAISIAEEQLKVLEPYAFENYITELAVHCDEGFPHLRKKMREEKLRETLKLAVEKTEQSRFTQRGPVQFYVDCFWGELESDPQYLWTKEILEWYQNLSQIEISNDGITKILQLIDTK